MGANVLQRKQITPAAMLRHVLLGWLLAAGLEYMALPGQLQVLTGLSGLREMSFGRVLLGTAFFGAFFFVLSFFYRIEKIQRWGIFGAFALLAISACAVSENNAFFLFCGLILGIFAVYSLCGWEKKEENAPQIKKAHLLETEYVVLKVSSTGDYTKYNSGGQENGYENLVKLLEKEGYVLHSNYGKILAVYRKAK